MDYIVDTNILMNKFYIDDFDKLYVPLTVLEELDKHKNSLSEEKKYFARCGIRRLKALKDEGRIEYVIDIDDYLDTAPCWLDMNVKDNIILMYSKFIQKNNDAILITADVNMYEKAIALNIKCRLFSCKDQDNYKGYVEITGNKEYIYNYFETIDYSSFVNNQYLIINDTDDMKTKEMRFDGKSFVPLKLPPSSYIKAKNSLQRCALDLLFNKDITTVAILGTYGSGKSYLCTQMALYNTVEKRNYEKILGIREPRGEGNEIGFLKGTFEDKTERFFKPLEQQLKKEEFDFLLAKGTFETSIPFYLKGTTYDDTVMIVDEAEDLSESQIRLIGTRVGENSKIYFSGDYGQSLINKTSSNPLVKMCNEFKGNNKFGCIYLNEDVRSETSRMFANLYKI